MRRSILKSFLGIAAAAALAGCEESEPPKVHSISPPVTSSVEVKPVEVKPVDNVVPAKAEPVAEEVVTTDEDAKLSPDRLIHVAREALDGGDLARGYELARMCTLKAPKRAASWNLFGRAQLGRGERKLAIESFEKAVELNPKSSFAQNNLGLALIYDGRFEDAADVLEEATQLEPVESYMWNNLGMAYEHLDRLDEARDAYRKSIDLKSGRGGNNLARLKDVKTIRTAKIETTTTPEPTTPDATK